MKRFIYYMAIFAMMITAFACNRQPAEMAVENVRLEPIATDTSRMGTFNMPQTEMDKQTQPVTNHNKKEEQQPSNNTASNNNINWDKKIIKTADILLQLDDYKKFNTLIHTSLKNFGAYIAGEKQTENDYRVENNLTIKVPVDQFDNLINSLAGEGIKITEKNISSDDVTGEVVDTKSRMQAKLAIRDKYLQLLKQAKNMNEILQVQDEVNSIQEDIEAANGRINYLQHASAYSTINLGYYQYINGSSASNERPDFFTKLFKAFSTGTTIISNLVLFCISIWPLLLIALFALVYLKRVKLKKVAKA